MSHRVIKYNVTCCYRKIIHAWVVWCITTWKWIIFLKQHVLLTVPIYNLLTNDTLCFLGIHSYTECYAILTRHVRSCYQLHYSSYKVIPSRAALFFRSLMNLIRQKTQLVGMSRICWLVFQSYMYECLWELVLNTHDEFMS